MGWTFYNSSGQQLRATADKTATQAEMEAASSTAAYATPGRTQYHPGVAKAWAQIDATTGAVIDASYNVSSVSDTATGQTTVNWDTDFSSTTYATIASGDGADGVRVWTMPNYATIAAGSIRVDSYSEPSAAYADVDFSVAAYGDQ